MTLVERVVFKHEGIMLECGTQDSYWHRSLALDTTLTHY